MTPEEKMNALRVWMIMHGAAPPREVDAQFPMRAFLHGCCRGGHRALFASACAADAIVETFRDRYLERGPAADRQERLPKLINGWKEVNGVATKKHAATWRQKERDEEDVYGGVLAAPPYESAKHAGEFADERDEAALARAAAAAGCVIARVRERLDKAIAQEWVAASALTMSKRYLTRAKFEAMISRALGDVVDDLAHLARTIADVWRARYVQNITPSRINFVRKTVPRQARQAPDENAVACEACGRRGRVGIPVVACAGCERVYHAECLHRRGLQCGGEWYCGDCVDGTANEPLCKKRKKSSNGLRADGAEGVAAADATGTAADNLVSAAVRGCVVFDPAVLKDADADADAANGETTAAKGVEQCAADGDGGSAAAAACVRVRAIFNGYGDTAHDGYVTSVDGDRATVQWLGNGDVRETYTCSSVRGWVRDEAALARFDAATAADVFAPWAPSSELARIARELVEDTTAPRLARLLAHLGVDVAPPDLSRPSCERAHARVVSAALPEGSVCTESTLRDALHIARNCANTSDARLAVAVHPNAHARVRVREGARDTDPLAGALEACARGDLDVGTCIPFVGEVRYDDGRAKYCIEVRRGVIVDPSLNAAASYVNHDRERQNVAFAVIWDPFDAPHVVWKVLRKIRSGETLWGDYGRHFSFEPEPNDGRAPNACLEARACADLVRATPRGVGACLRAHTSAFDALAEGVEHALARVARAGAATVDYAAGLDAPRACDRHALITIDATRAVLSAMSRQPPPAVAPLLGAWVRLATLVQSAEKGRDFSAAACKQIGPALARVLRACDDANEIACDADAPVKTVLRALKPVRGSPTSEKVVNKALRAAQRAIGKRVDIEAVQRALGDAAADPDKPCRECRVRRL